MKSKVLIVGSDVAHMHFLESLLRRRYQSSVTTPARALRHMRAQHFDVFLITQTVDTQAAADLISQATDSHPGLNIVWLADWETPLFEDTEGKVVQMNQRLRHFMTTMSMFSANIH